MQSFQAFWHAIYSKLLERSAALDEAVGEGELVASEGSGDQPHDSGVPKPQDMSDVMASVWIQANVVRFGPLEDAVDR